MRVCVRVCVRTVSEANAFNVAGKYVEIHVRCGFVLHTGCCILIQKFGVGKKKPAIIVFKFFLIYRGYQPKKLRNILYLKGYSRNHFVYPMTMMPM